MRVTAVSTPLVNPGDDLLGIIGQSISKLPERSVVVVTSKVVSFWERRLVPKRLHTKEEKQELVKKEADYYLPYHPSHKYQMMLTIKGNTLFVNAGIDESNSNLQYSLWPIDPQVSANRIWRFLRQHYRVKQVGVTISDSRSYPLNWGVVGQALCHCGFKVLKSYIGKSDLFGYVMKMEQVNVGQAVTVAAVLVMGEGNERTPMAMVENVPGIEFQDRPPTKKELEALRIKLEDDAYAPILTKVKWHKGEGGIRTRF